MTAIADKQPQILVVDDKRNMLRLMQKVFGDSVHVRTAESGPAAIKILEEHDVDVVLCDLRMPGIDGLEVLRGCRRLRPRAEFILMTAFASVETAVEAMRLGAYDYVTKPLDPTAARAVVMSALSRAAVSGEHPVEEVLPGLIARSDVMHDLADMVQRVAESDATALILGETGTGKERIARAIHRLSGRTARRFVAVNCAAIPSDIMESELFGYSRGAFTGATRDRAGMFEEANGGTLFLDEIGELRLSLQAKLTRALEEQAVRRLGQWNERPVDVRLVAATHRQIEGMLRDGTFREDLWYRLNVAVIRVPPLRERREDIMPLARHFLGERIPRRGHRLTGFTQAAESALERFDWPGNVRQLRAAVERASVLVRGTRIGAGDLPDDVIGNHAPGEPTHRLSGLPWTEAMRVGRDRLARDYLAQILEVHDGRVAEAAADAGVERESFYRLLRRHGLDPSIYRSSQGRDE